MDKRIGSMFTAALVVGLGGTGCRREYKIGENDPKDTAPPIEEGDDTGTPPEDTNDYSEFDDARLVILEPTASEVLPMGEPSDFTAALYDSSGAPMAFTDVVWSSDIDPTWVRTGTYFQDDSLIVGVHTLTAQASLPNGDHVSSTVGGVRVQHPDAGLYAGTVRVDISTEIKGTAVTGACYGTALVSVDELGQTATGSTSCALNFSGYELDMAYNFDLALDGGFVDGDANLDLSFYEYAMPATGTIGDGVLSATWSGDILGFATVAGSMELVRVNDDPHALE